MKQDTGKSYMEEASILAAEARGENLVPISSRAAKFIREARAAKAKRLRFKRRRRDAMQRASRRRNRR